MDSMTLYRGRDIGTAQPSAGDRTRAAELLESALALNPRFDPKQSAIARDTLAELRAFPPRH